MHWKACAIDGPGGSGKSTLAARLASDLGANVISMDSFLLPEGKNRPSAIARNYDLNRFYLEVIEPILDHKDINYRVMDLATSSLRSDRVNVAADKRVVIEGVYSMELNFRESYDFTIFVDAPKTSLMSRAFSLDPGSSSWLDKWNDGEETYLVAQNPKQAAMLVLDGSKPFPSTAQIMEDLESLRPQS